jgi:protein kinase A
VKHLLRRDLSKRFGNLKNGAEDIKTHRFFENFSWQNLLLKKMDVPYMPKVDP